MAEENNNPGLTSKRKLVVEKTSFFHAPRSTVGFDSNSSYLRNDMVDQSNNASWFAKIIGYNENEQSICDPVRVVLGKNWDHRSANPTETDQKIFSNNWDNPKVFYNSPIHLEYCGDTQIINDDDDVETLNDQVESEKIVLSCEVPGINSQFREAKISDWFYYMKSGAELDTGNEYYPVVRTRHRYTDHYHKAINPFTPLELESLQPIGKAFYADYKTYYNERSRVGQSVSSNFESVTGQNINLQNSLPSVYSFLKLMLNPQLANNNFLDFNYMLIDLLPYALTEKNDIYKTILKKYPFEAAVLLYGVIGQQFTGPFAATKIVQKIISSNFDKVDADSLFSDYYREFADRLSIDNFQIITSEQNNRMLALERILYNIIFSPESTKFLNKVDQYKKHFPFYSEIEFTADIFTSVGDSMKQMFLTKFIGEAILARFTRTPDKEFGYVTLPDEGVYKGFPFEFSLTDIPPDIGQGTAFTSTGNLIPFIDYYEEKTFSDVGGQNIEFRNGSYVENLRKTMRFDTLLKRWIQPETNIYLESESKSVSDQIEGIYFGPQKDASNQNFDPTDMRNYTSYFRNDLNEPIDINSDDNIIFKKLFGAAFQAKILDLYKKHKRSYSEILDGQPAYTEDLFYKIAKIRIDPVTGQEKNVQNIMIPNTSELDLVKYVDTQLKYFTYAQYRYDVYAYRIVFGASYKYFWINPLTGENTNERYDTAKFDLTKDLPIEDELDRLAEFGNGLAKNATVAGQATTTGAEAPIPQAFPGGSAGSNFESPAGTSAFGEDLPIQAITPVISGEDNFVEKTKLTATFRVHVSPSVVIVPDKIFSTPTIMIMDKPPVVPDINIIPYRAVNNRIKILMTGASDRYRVEPVIMLESDIEEFRMIAAAQLSTDGKIEFGSDDPVKSFQIFRTQKKPMSYQDFELYQQTSDQHYEEKILPNTKYYYTFRAIDAHGHVSNPSPVYQVELIDEKGAVKPIIRLYDMTPPSNKSLSKQCQKYVYIKPNLQQLYFSDSESVNSIFSNDNVKKRYKMRITSKGSGKKIDVNFSFKKKIQSD